MTAILREQLLDSLAQVEVERAVHEVRQAVAYVQELQRAGSNAPHLWAEMGNLFEARKHLRFVIRDIGQRGKS
jgi:hypothetical protein